MIDRNTKIYDTSSVECESWYHEDVDNEPVVFCSCGSRVLLSQREEIEYETHFGYKCPKCKQP